MPPRRGIVKTGNAGNSTKTSKPLNSKETTSSNDKSSKTGKSSQPALAPLEADKPLFPPGSKTPLSLLHERCVPKLLYVEFCTLKFEKMSKERVEQTHSRLCWYISELSMIPSTRYSQNVSTGDLPYSESIVSLKLPRFHELLITCHRGSVDLDLHLSSFSATLTKRRPLRNPFDLNLILLISRLRPWKLAIGEQHTRSIECV